MVESKKRTKKTTPAADPEAIENKTDEIPEETTEELVITSAKQWRKDNINIRVLRLPSGLNAKVRNVNLPTLATSGAFPLPLLTKCLELRNKLTSINTDNPEETLKDFDTDDVAAFAKMIDKITLNAIIDPVITENDTEDENTIPVGELEFQDKVFILQNCIGGGAAGFASFLR